MKTIALIEKGKDGKYGIYTPDLKSTIIGSGDTVAEAMTDFERSLSEIRSAFRDAGESLPKELQNVEFEYKYDIASVFDYFDYINATRFAARAGVNASLLRQYKSGGTYISEKQALKIENALHRCGEELLSLSLLAH
jgi:predicted RNase H-like HicB family nuclease